MSTPNSPEALARSQRCRICECTETDSCVGPCSWVEPDLCSTCAETLIAIVEYCTDAGPAARRAEAYGGSVAISRLIIEATRMLQEEFPGLVADRPMVIIP
jgi:hypothetical protein